MFKEKIRCRNIGMVVSNFARRNCGEMQHLHWMMLGLCLQEKREKDV
jgi:hypothetical protein